MHMSTRVTFAKQIQYLESRIQDCFGIPNTRCDKWDKLSTSVKYGYQLGTSRSDNGDFRENLTGKQAPNPFKPFRDYPKSPSYLKEGNLCWS